MLTCCCGKDSERKGVSAAGDHACFIINPLSGGGAGRRLLRRIRKALPQCRACDMLKCDMDLELQRASQDRELVLICGGDGSLTHVLERIYRLSLDLAPALVPLGTGNDLARVCGWFGLQYLRPFALLEAAASARPQLLDRMELSGPGISRSWYNYCSWGLDAEIALAFDRMRKRYPGSCLSRHINLLWYSKLAFAHQGRDLHALLNTELKLPGSMRSLLCTNIPSYGGGMHLSPVINARDQHFDVFALPSSLHLLRAVTGRRHLRCLARRQSLALELRSPLPMQCDGEAWMAAAGSYHIRCQGAVHVLTRR